MHNDKSILKLAATQMQRWAMTTGSKSIWDRIYSGLENVCADCVKLPAQMTEARQNDILNMEVSSLPVTA